MTALPIDQSVVGRSLWDLDTPALCVDLDILDANITTLEQRLVGTGIASRPHAKTHKCAEIAKRQLAAGSIGICTAKVSEAEALFNGGIEPILLTTSAVTPAKMRRAMALRQRNPRFIQATDHPQNARDLSEIAGALGITADVVIDVAIGARSGVPADERALALAQLVDRLPHLSLRGLISYDGMAQHITGYETRTRDTLARFEPSVRVFEAMRRSGLSTEIFSGGGTGTYDIMATVPGVTDVQAGSYIFLDAQYLAIGGRAGPVYDDFTPSLTVLTTIVNTYFANHLTTDAGTKSLTVCQPGPIVVGEPEFRYHVGSDEFGVISYSSSNRSYAVGDKLQLIVPHCDPVVNEYDVIHATRSGRVEAVWAIDARGCSQ